MDKKVREELQKFADPKRAEVSQRYFKTGKGEYAEGDIFIGLSVPNVRLVAKKFPNLDFIELKKLLSSKVHEERQAALFILTDQYKKADVKKKEKIYKFYLGNTKNINNWDLVDLSAHKIVGEYLDGKDWNILKKLARSKNLWERRIAIISTFHFIANSNFEATLFIAQMLLDDKEDLIHKAVGWALREVGKKNQEAEEAFLHKHYKKMPRTALRYAIERFNEKLRKAYLEGTI